MVTLYTDNPGCFSGGNMKLQSNLSRTFFFLVMFIGAVMFCTARESGICIGGWLGIGEGVEESEETTKHGGVDLELRLFGFLGVQTGISIFQDLNSLSYDSVMSNTVIQIPVLATINFNLAVYFLSIHAGVGMNLSSIGEDNISIRSFSKFSYIFGGKFGMILPFNYSNVYCYVGYQYNCDFSATVYRYMDNRFKYVGERSILTVGLSFLIPF